MAKRRRPHGSTTWSNTNARKLTVGKRGYNRSVKIPNDEKALRQMIGRMKSANNKRERRKAKLKEIYHGQEQASEVQQEPLNTAEQAAEFDFGEILQQQQP